MSFPLLLQLTAGVSLALFLLNSALYKLQKATSTPTKSLLQALFGPKNSFIVLNFSKSFYFILFAFCLGAWFVTNQAPLPNQLFLLFVLFFFVLFLGEAFPYLLFSATSANLPSFLLLQLVVLPLLLSFPFILPLLWISNKKELLDEKNTSTNHRLDTKEGLHFLLQQNEALFELEPKEQKILTSFFSFRERKAREVMVPRPEIFALPSTATLEKASIEIQEAGFSRVPVYKNSVDEIVGVLFWKDLLAKYLDPNNEHRNSFLNEPIEPLLRPAFFTPETKKISLLLQEFQKKQVHMAIVVDEFGVTQGIVTIEDILEELVGEIEDEYDEEAGLYQHYPQGGFLVDGRMTVYDIRKQLGVDLPEDGDYDTLGGYILHTTAKIPEKGFSLHADTFSLEVMEATEKQIVKVRLCKRETS